MLTVVVGGNNMSKPISDTLFKYLTAFQLMILVFTLFMNLYGFDTDREVIMGIGILLVAAFVYKKDKDNKVELNSDTVTPDNELIISKAVDIICEAFGLKDKKQEQIEMLKAKIEQLQMEKAEV